MLRLIDILLSSLGIILTLPLFLIITFIGFIDTGSPIFRQQRVGKEKKLFTLVKFRTMKKEAVSVATHLAKASDITFFGQFLRKNKLDELPQLWNVLKGEMSLVGPRPCLLCQKELILRREEQDVFSVRPGITGLAQVSKIDMSTPELLAKTDAQMINNLGIKDYFHYIFLTILGRGSGDRVKLP